MNVKMMGMIAENTNKKWFLLQCEVADVLGLSRQTTAEFIKEHSIPYYCIGKLKKYFLGDVIEIVEKKRWAN